jgi:hypothetical protein
MFEHHRKFIEIVSLEGSVERDAAALFLQHEITNNFAVVRRNRDHQPRVPIELGRHQLSTRTPTGARGLRIIRMKG